MGLGRKVTASFRPGPLGGGRGSRDPDGRVLPTGRRHRGAQGGADSRLRRRPWAPAHARWRSSNCASKRHSRPGRAKSTARPGDDRGVAPASRALRRRRDPDAWVAGLSDRNDLPLLRAGDLADEILSDAASVTIRKVSERRATFSRANVLAEVHRQFHGVRFASPDDRIAVAERTADLATAQSLLISAPELHFTPERLRRADGTSRFRAKGHEIYTTAALLEAEGRLLEAGREMNGPSVATGTVGAVTSAALPGRNHPLSIDQALAVEQVATSGRRLDVLVGPAGTGKSTAMAGLRAAWEAEHGAGSVLGLAPSAAAAEVLAERWGSTRRTPPSGSMNTAKEPSAWQRLPTCRTALRSPATSRRRSSLHAQRGGVEEEVARWKLRAGQLVIVDEASLVGTFALDELVAAAREARAKVLLVGDPGPTERNRRRRDVRRFGTRSGRPGGRAHRCTPVREPMGEDGQCRIASRVP